MRTKIGWCDYSLNPGIFGCTPVSTECENCYAARMAHRQVAMGNYPEGITEQTANGVKWTGKVILGSSAYVFDTFAKMPVYKQGRVFVTSMGDLFHEQVHNTFLLNVYQKMAEYKHLTFMVLTKRPERLFSFLEALKVWDQGKYSLLPNVYYGITGGTQETFDERWHWLRLVEAAKFFVSAEPLLSSIRFPKELLNMGDRVQVIWGGEMGPGARVMRPEWARSIRDQLEGTGIKRYFKQWGTLMPKSQLISGVHTSELFNYQPGSGDVDPDGRFIKVTGAGISDILDGETIHEHLELA